MKTEELIERFWHSSRLWSLPRVYAQRRHHSHGMRNEMAEVNRLASQVAACRHPPPDPEDAHLGEAHERKKSAMLWGCSAKQPHEARAWEQRPMPPSPTLSPTLVMRGPSRTTRVGKKPANWPSNDGSCDAFRCCFPLSSRRQERQQKIFLSLAMSTFLHMTSVGESVLSQPRAGQTHSFEQKQRAGHEG